MSQLRFGASPSVLPFHSFSVQKTPGVLHAQSVKVGRVWEAALSISARLPVKVHCVTSNLSASLRLPDVPSFRRRSAVRIVAPRPLPSTCSRWRCPKIAVLDGRVVRIVVDEPRQPSAPRIGADAAGFEDAQTRHTRLPHVAGSNCRVRLVLQVDAVGVSAKVQFSMRLRTDRAKIAEAQPCTANPEVQSVQWGKKHALVAVQCKTVVTTTFWLPRMSMPWFVCST